MAPLGGVPPRNPPEKTVAEIYPVPSGEGDPHSHPGSLFSAGAVAVLSASSLPSAALWTSPAAAATAAAWCRPLPPPRIREGGSEEGEKKSGLVAPVGAEGWRHDGRRLRTRGGGYEVSQAQRFFSLFSLIVVLQETWHGDMFLGRGLGRKGEETIHDHQTAGEVDRGGAQQVFRSFEAIWESLAEDRRAYRNKDGCSNKKSCTEVLLKGPKGGMKDKPPNDSVPLEHPPSTPIGEGAAL
ncbi:hypothetical protein Taro_019672 [Colocasia esculenta]|uniref:Uncharacterized protein n=1 Tax=Colocasia esculenta TaxID=4460 RepID=A0A843ULM1_COLES|nr:hypothetical protein [Colocasia esculenta]